MRKTLLTLFIGLLLIPVTAQSQQAPRNQFLIDLFGNGYVYSLCYERNLNHGSLFNFNLGGGISLFPNFISNHYDKKTFEIGFPLFVECCIGKHNNKLDVTVTSAETFGQDKEEFWFNQEPYLSLGYRYQPSDKKFCFRTYVSLGYDNELLPNSVISPGVSFGYLF